MHYLFSVASQLQEIGVRLILIQIHEAHSDAWPVGLKDQPTVQQSFQDRVERANRFAIEHKVPYDIYIDGWDDQFEQGFRAWPDRYFLVDLNDHNPVITRTSTYNMKMDALVDYDCQELVYDLLKD